MKRALIVLSLALVTVFIASEAFAVSVSADAPLNYTFSSDFLNAQKNARPKDRTVTDVQGYVLGAGYGWFGVGYEKFDVNADVKLVGVAGPKIGFTSSFQIYDVFVDLPTPYIHPRVGYGVGQVSTSVDNVAGAPPTKVKTAGVNQYFLSLGVSIFPTLDLHVGYHNLTAQDAKISGGGGPAGDKFKNSGSMYTAGLRLAW